MRKETRIGVLFVLSLIAFGGIAGCESPGQKLAVAEAAQTTAQDLWTGALTNRTVRDRTSIIVGTAALNHSTAAVAKAYQASTQPAPVDADGNTVDVFGDWAAEAKTLAQDAGETIARLMREAAAKKAAR